MIIVALAGGYAALLLLTQMPYFQFRVSQATSEMLSQKFGTDIKIGKIELGMFNRLILQNVSIYDKQKKPLLVAARLSAKIKLRSVVSRPLTIRTIELYGARIAIRKENKNIPYNFMFIVDSLSSGNNKKSTPLDIRIKSIIISKTDITHDICDAPQRKGFDINHASLSKTDASINLQIIRGDSLKLRVRNLAFNEKCGLKLRRSYILCNISRRGCDIPIMQLETDKSTVEIKSTILLFGESNGGKIVNGMGQIKNTIADIGDLNAFAPHLNLPSRKYYVDAKFEVVDNVVGLPYIQITNKHATILSAQATYKDSQNFMAKLKKLYLPTEETTFIASTASKDTMLQNYVRRIGYIECSGTIESKHGDFFGRGKLKTQVGNLDFAGSYDAHNGYDAHISTDNFQLGKLFPEQNALGTAIFSIKCNGKPENRFSATVAIPHVEINNYKYSDVRAVAVSENGKIAYDLKSADPNATLSATGCLTKHGKKKLVTLACNIEQFNPNAVGLTSKYPDTKLSLQAEVNVSANDMNDAVGHIAVKNAYFVHPDSTFVLSNLDLSAMQANNGRRILLNGDFGTVELTGMFDFKSLPSDVMNIIRSDVNTSGAIRPIFADNAAGKKEKGLSGNNNFSFHANITDLELVNQLLGIGIKVKGDNFVSGYIDSRNRNLLLESKLPKLQWKGLKFSDFSVYLRGSDSLLHSNIHFAKVQKGGKTNLEIEAHRKENAINCNLMWKGDGEHDYSGEIMQKITFPYDDASVVNFDIAPSLITIDDTTWNVSPARLSYVQGTLEISGFRLQRGDKHLSLDGAVSKIKSDSLQLQLSGIRIRDITDMIAFDDVEFDGIATGKVNISDFFDTPAVNADLEVKNFKFNNAPMGNMNLSGTWKNVLKQVDLDAHIEETQGMTDVKGFVNTGQGTIDLHFAADNTNAAFLNKFFPDAVSIESGRTSGSLRLHGKLKAMNLEGVQTLSSMVVRVAPLGTSYSLDGDTVSFTTDTMKFHGLDLVDKYGNHARMTGRVTHRALHNFAYDFNIASNKFLAYDCPRSPEISFWGTAFTNGNIHIYGSPGQFWTEATVQPARNTVFTYNADRPDSPENTQLLTFRNADTVEFAGNSSPEERIYVAKETEKTTDIRLNFTFDLTPDAEICVIMNEEAGNVISARGTGNIHAMYYNKGTFEMFGNFDIQSGTYKMNLQDLIHKDFNFRRGGTVTFNGDPFAGDLNLQAVYTVPSVSLSDLTADGNLRDNSVKVDCIMNFSGSVGQPVVKFDLDMPSVSSDELQMVRSLIATPEDMNLQIVYLLSFGRFYTYNFASQTMTTSQSQSSLAMNSFLSNTLSSNLNSLLSNVLEESKWTFGTNVATGKDGWNNMDVEGLFTGHLLNNRLILNGNLGYRDRAAYNSNFVGDFSVLYLLNQRGTIQLKAYSESNDRYFTKSTLTTQGGGIVFKRNFTKIKDIFRSRKPSDGK